MLFYREDTGEKLLIPDQLAQALRQEVLASQQAEEPTRTPTRRASRITGSTIEGKVAFTYGAPKAIAVALTLMLLIDTPTLKRMLLAS